MSKQGVVPIRGKEYETVALRVHKFRSTCLDFGLVTEIIHLDDSVVRVKASVYNDQNRLIATGHAEEYRKASDINKTSALENCETSAIGRALAAFGFGGTEFASADEMNNAINAQNQPSNEVMDELVAGLREAAMGGSKALQDAFKALPATVEKKLAWDKNGNSLKAAAKEADLAVKQ
mgnify:CR=1 FL=1